MFAIPRPEGEVSDEAAGLENSVVDLRSYKLTSLVMSLFSVVRKSKVWGKFLDGKCTFFNESRTLSNGLQEPPVSTVCVNSKQGVLLTCCYWVMRCYSLTFSPVIFYLLVLL